MTTYTEKEHFNHSIEEHRLPILLDALFWFHCQRYFPHHNPNAENSFSAYHMSCETFTPTVENVLETLQPIDYASRPTVKPYDYRNEQKESDE